MIDPTHTPPSTIRALWERVQERHFVDPNWKIQTGGSVCAKCHLLWPCLDYSDAVAALRLLDEADTAPLWEWPDGQTPFRLIPDPSRGDPEPNEHA